MTDPNQLSFDEILLVGGLIALITAETWNAATSRQWVDLFRPTLIIAAILAFYCLLGPLWLLNSGELVVQKGLGGRLSMVWGWAGALFFYAALLFGFHQLATPRFNQRFLADIQPEHLHKLGRALCLVGLAMFALAFGPRAIALLNPVAGINPLVGWDEGGADIGAFANYFNYAVNFLIPGIALMFTAWMTSKRDPTQVFLWLLGAIGIYTSLGFRYRLVILLIPIILLWYMLRQRRPNPIVILAIAAAAILVAGVVGASRQYGLGLDPTKLQGKGLYDFFTNALGETNVFFTTAGVMKITPSESPFVGLDPLIATVLFPIPRVLLPGKPGNEYISNVTSILYGGAKYASGTAILNFAEYYLMFGWLSLVAGGLFMGWLVRCLWNWFLMRLHEPFAYVIYVISASFLYVAISRGYLPQVALLFGFSVYPLFWLYGRWARPVQQLGAGPAAVPRS
ncbi:hypothetical protein KQ306_01300 [Synechococcus sp. CS-1324]|uniref:hypothetical protein n=1 Tax=Synechococcus sp. CS-1324 TaxID=2847980 RepID=UPI000DB6FA9D|nr:hypothetical protein [Synechococcus sp. CS-1324]MCT0229499.1 hypothetical protein [Synechococcus sp. CS-1324]PZV04880.1 MAG: hypothetical protein DCF23_05055 [Cyanobium sp.]